MSKNLNIDLNIENENEQVKFIETSIGKCVSSALDVGICYIFPDFIENQVISLKNNILENGLKDALSNAFDILKKTATTTKSMFSGKLSSVEEYDLALSDNGILNIVSDAIKEGIYKAYKSNKISYSNYVNINKYKNVIIDGFKSNLKQNNKYLKNIESNAKYLLNEFDRAYQDKDIENIKQIKEKLSSLRETLLPTKDLFDSIEIALNKFTLLESKEFSFDISDEEMQLVGNFSTLNV